MYVCMNGWVWMDANMWSVCMCMHTCIQYLYKSMYLCMSGCVYACMNELCMHGFVCVYGWRGMDECMWYI